MPASSEEIIDLDDDDAPESNLDIDEQELLETLGLKGKRKVTRFETTPRMSTYLAVFANGHFNSIETSVKSPLTGNDISLAFYGMSTKTLCLNLISNLV